MDFFEIGERISLIFVPFLFAICFHEWAHAWAAKKLGDPTADLMGRLTLNPIAHMDIIGTVVFPMMAILSGGGFFFGWAKPVPVSERNLRHPRKDMFWIALAGPASNFFLAFVGALIFALNSRFNPSLDSAKALSGVFQFFVIINLALAFFNLIPVHPLDGGKIMARFLPERINIWLEENSQMIGFALLFLIIADGFSGRGASFLSMPILFTANLFLGFWGYIFTFLI
jgi:Zn-dependent protease